MAVNTKRYTGTLVDENFKKKGDYKLLASCVHVELDRRKTLGSQFKRLSSFCNFKLQIQTKTVQPYINKVG